MVICEYCTRDVREKDPEQKPVWVPIRQGQSVVKRKLPVPRVKKNAPGKTIPLFMLDSDGKPYKRHVDRLFNPEWSGDPKYDRDEDVPF